VRDLQAFFWLRAFSTPQALSTPAHTRVMQTVMQPSISSVIYQTCTKGHLDEHWMRSFEGLTVSAESNGETLISGEMDQSALFGVLNRLRDLGLELVSVQRKLT
jgi:hypothetical protein